MKGDGAPHTTSFEGKYTFLNHIRKQCRRFVEDNRKRPNIIRTSAVSLIPIKVATKLVLLERCGTNAMKYTRSLILSTVKFLILVILVQLMN